MTASASTVLAATAGSWDTSGRLPRPRPGLIACPVCRGEGLVIRYWQFHTRPVAATWPYRCDVSLKCASCAALWAHGVAIDPGAWARRPVPSGSLCRVLMAARRGLGLGCFEPIIWERRIRGRGLL